MNETDFSGLLKSVREAKQLLRGERKAAREFVVEVPPASAQLATSYAVCVQTDDPSLLTPRKIYLATYSQTGLVRVVDEAGESALYPPRILCAHCLAQGNRAGLGASCSLNGWLKMKADCVPYACCLPSNPLDFFLIILALLTLTLPVQAQKRTLVWADEFTGAAGAAPDTAKWGYDIGTGANGWGNNELQYYTDRPQNAALDGQGHLVITALKESFTGPNGVTRAYTSARLVTRGKFTTTYGRIEARLKVPFGQGIWPAFWLLGENISTVGWPSCGEIDVMENIGREPATVHGTLHGPGYSGSNPLTGSVTLPNGQRFADDFHTFAVEWEPRTIRFFVDDQLYQTRRSAELNANQRWVFDHPFYLLLNLAVGGNWPGNPDATTTFPQVLTVDYVRVYSLAGTSLRREEKRSIQN